VADQSDAVSPYAPVPQEPGRTDASKRAAPERPSLANPNKPPVIVKVPAPFFVRLSQLFWMVSLALGAFIVVYFFVIRETLLPLIQDVLKTVAEGRDDTTYATAGDILYWTVFAGMVTILAIQITLLVSFSSRRPNVRWWQLGSFVVQVLLYLLALELVALGEHGTQLRQLFIGQCALVLLGLLCSITPKALNWSARQHDVRRGSAGDVGAKP